MCAAPRKKKRASYQGRTEPIPTAAVGERQPELTRENVRAFLNRDWELLRRLKDAHSERTVRERGTTWAFAMLQDLIDTVISWGGDLSRHDRSEDLAAHVALKRKLDRTAPRRHRPSA